jgi:hypothetical protein
VHVTTTRGTLLTLLDNPYHRSEFYAMGMSPDVAFGCALDFLLAPRPGGIHNNNQLPVFLGWVLEGLGSGSVVVCPPGFQFS